MTTSTLSPSTLSNLDRFAVGAADTAMLAAADWMDANGHPVRAILKNEPEAIDRLCAIIRETLTGEDGAISLGLADAREAIAAGMGGFAEATFKAAMRVAGIEAAQRWAVDRPRTDLASWRAAKH